MDNVKKFRCVHWLPAIIWAVIILILSSTPSSQMPDFSWTNIVSIDKIGHIVFYGILTLLMLWGIWRDGHNLSLILMIVIILVATFYGLTIEILQYSFFEERHFEVLDLIANIIGSIIGAIAFKFFKN